MNCEDCQNYDGLFSRSFTESYFQSCFLRNVSIFKTWSVDVCCFWTIKVTGNARNVSNTRASVMNTRANTTANVVLRKHNKVTTWSTLESRLSYFQGEKKIFALSLGKLYMYPWIQITLQMTLSVSVTLS